MAVVCRPARIDDLKQADDIVVASINELTERRGVWEDGIVSPDEFSGLLARGRSRRLMGGR